MYKEEFAVLFEEVRLLRKEVIEFKSKLDSVLNDRPIMVNRDDLDHKITAFLHELKVSAKLKGYRMVREAIKLVIHDYTLVNFITTELYPMIAREFNEVPSRVERAIRHAIETSYDKNYFHPFYQQCHLDHKPTNSEFIAGIADRFRLQAKQMEAVGQE